MTDPTKSVRYIANWPNMASIIAAWMLVYLVCEQAGWGVEFCIYSCIGQNVMSNKNIIPPILAGKFDAAGGMRWLYWSMWWPYYALRDIVAG